MPKRKDDGGIYSSTLDLIRGMDRISKVLCGSCKKKAEKAVNEWMAEEFERDKNRSGRLVRTGKKAKSFRLIKDL